MVCSSTVASVVVSFQTRMQLNDLAALLLQDADYVSHFCEENIYKLAERFSRLQLEDYRHQFAVYVVFISNPNRQTPIWQQKLSVSYASDDDEKDCPVFWDYHVVLVVKCAGKGVDDISLERSPTLVLDFDTQLGPVCLFDRYVQESFRPHYRLRNEFQQ